MISAIYILRFVLTLLHNYISFSLNEALNTFYLWLYGIGHRGTKPVQIVREETRCSHIMSYYFQLADMDILYAPSHRLQSTYHGAFFTPGVEHWVERDTVCTLFAKMFTSSSQ